MSKTNHLLLTTIIVIGILTNSSNVNAKKLKVSLYYESLCPYSVRFITNHLYPTYSDFRDFIDIQFVPFGKAISYNGGEYFECQHGEPECVGNMIQSCTLYSLNGLPDEKMDYVACQMNVDTEPTGELCANKVNVLMKDVNWCQKSGLGLQLQLEAERITHTVGVPYPKSIPTVVYNNNFNQTLQERSIVDFADVVCELIDRVAPICQN